MTGHRHPARWARSMWAAAEPFASHGLVSAATTQATTALGIEPRSSFFAVRGAPLGRADAAAAAAAFHAFPAGLLRRVLTPVWDEVSPHEVIDATHRAIPRYAAASLGIVDPVAVRRVGDLLSGAIGELDMAGRPLAAGNQAIAAPDEPWARLWRAWTTLREYRGDAHVAVLVAHDLGVDEAQVLSATWKPDQVDVELLRRSRRLDDERWVRACEALRDRALLEGDGSAPGDARLTAAGRALRDEIEHRTDEASSRVWRSMSAAQCADVYDLTRSLSEPLVDAGLAVPKSAVGAPWPPPALD